MPSPVKVGLVNIDATLGVSLSKGFFAFLKKARKKLFIVGNPDVENYNLLTCSIEPLFYKGVMLDKKLVYVYNGPSRTPVPTVLARTVLFDCGGYSQISHFFD